MIKHKINRFVDERTASVEKYLLQKEKKNEQLAT